MRTTLSVPVVPSDHAWDPVFELRHCADCGATTPAHLAERWGNVDVAEARAAMAEQLPGQQPLQAVLLAVRRFAAGRVLSAVVE